jgi:hypothetical protein
MYGGLLGLHSLLRWAMIIFLIINIVRVNVEADQHFDKVDKAWSLRLLVTTHVNLLVALYLYFFGPNGLQVISTEKYTAKDVMEQPNLRFWLIEHPIMMLISITIITISHTYSKKDIEPKKKHRIMSILYIIALLIILAAVPWPFRGDGIGRPVFRALY